ncbi:MAG: FAD-binding oxidoreductase [Gammaproteobacteria bacterium]|jgi:cytochrome-b5 reductase
MDYRAKVLFTEFVTHDVTRFILEKPQGLAVVPGQGVEVTIDQEGWRDRGRPFTPTSLAEDEILEFTIKHYLDRDGVTRKLTEIHPGDHLGLSDAFGTIRYQGAGVFVAGGAGITPFLAILRQLHRDGDLAGNRLLFSNRTPADIICEKELRHRLGGDCLLTCTRESAAGYLDRRIDRAFLEQHVTDFNQHFYICGPKVFVTEVRQALEELGADSQQLVFER